MAMAWSSGFVDKLCWRLKALGAPKVHELVLLLQFALCMLMILLDNLF